MANVANERMQLALARAELKVALRNELDDASRARLGLDPATNIDELIEGRSSTFIDTINEDISAKDEAFRKLRLSRVAAAAGIGVASGLTLGVIGQETMAAFDSTRAGLVEQTWSAETRPVGDGSVHQTILHGVVHGDHAAEHHGPSSKFTSTHIGEKGTLQLSSDYSLAHNPDGTLNFLDQDGHVAVDHLAVNPDGGLSPESIQLLESRGMTVEDVHTTIDVLTHEPRTVKFHDYMNHHRADTTHVRRDLWYDNNTSAPVFDKNELGLHWGGAEGKGVTPRGYQFDISTMTDTGSTHGDQAVRWTEAARAGHLQLAISPSAGEQATPFMLNIKAGFNPDGTIWAHTDIPKDSPAGQFFSVKDGQAVFHGRYAEVVQVGKVDGKGITHIRPLATVVGADNASQRSFHDIVSVHTPETHPGYKITSPGYDTPGTFTEMAPVIPVVSRRSMEAVRRTENPVGPEERRLYYGNYMPPEALKAMREETSPRLIDDPNRSLNPQEELAWYKDLVKKKRGSDYVDEIEKLIATSPELTNISSNLKTIVKIPVNAAGTAESENIYNVLAKAYAEQDPSALDQSMILLHVNWFSDLMADPSKRTTIEKTQAEIARAKADFPQLRIATIESEWDREAVSDGVIGHVSRRLNDAALFAIEGAMSRGEIDGNQDVLLIRNDADPKGMSKNYLRRYIDEADKYKEVDIFTGTTSFDNTKAGALPGFVYAANFMQSLNLLSAAREGEVTTGGANFGIRASVLAAVGSTGFDEYVGAGSDDVSIGRRVTAARGGRISPSRSGQTLSSYFTEWRQKKNSYVVSSGPNATLTTSKARKVGRRVFGARIDTDSDREEVLYRRGVPIVRTWDEEFGFSENGYKEREADLSGQAREDVLTDPSTVVERIRNDMEGSINFMGTSRAVVDTALRLAFGSTDGYRLMSHPSSDRPRGVEYVLELTDAGRSYLANHLLRDSRGRPDGYGIRKLRQMYGEATLGTTGRSTRRQMIRV